MRRASSKPARRQAKQDRSRRTIEVVVEAAARVLQREGYARATTNRIADVAGVSVGTIYQYFAHKDQIFDALIRREIDGVLVVLERLAGAPPLPLAQDLERVLALLVRARPDAPLLHRSLEQVPNALFRRRVEAARGAVIAWVRRFLESHRAEIHAREVDLDVASFILVASAEGVAIGASPEFYRERGARELARFFLRSLGAGETRTRPRRTPKAAG